MDALFLSVLNMSLTASYVIAVICVVRLLLKGAPKSVSYALWGVVGFRLVFPFSFESVYSLLPFNAEPIPQNIAYQTAPSIETGIYTVDRAVSGSLPAPVIGSNVNPLQILLWLGSYIWLAGIVVMLIYSLVSAYILEKRLKSVRLSEENVYESDNIKTPFVLGFFKPRIYIPEGLPEEEKSYILLHERTHIRRCDHVVKIMAYFILCVHWFNPFAWLAFLLMGADMELSCDERVLREMGGNIKKEYSSTLLSFATGRIISGSPLAFGEGGVKARIKNVLNFKKPARVAVIASIAVVVALSVGFTFNRTKLDLENIPIGTPKSKVYEAFGGPGASLSDFQFDVYFKDNGYGEWIGIIIHYDEAELVDNVNMTKAAIGDPVVLEPPFLTVYSLRNLAYRGVNLTLEEIVETAGNGLDISFDNDYRILVYEVENDMRLIVRSNPAEKPESVILESLSAPGEGIDIRYENVDEFMSKWTNEFPLNNSGDTRFPHQNTGTEKEVFLFSEHYKLAGLDRNEWVEWSELYRYKTPGTQVFMQFETDGSNTYKFVSEQGDLISEMDAFPKENVIALSSGGKVRGIRSEAAFFINRDDLRKIGFHNDIDRKTWVSAEELCEETSFDISIVQDNGGTYRLFSALDGLNPVYELEGLTEEFMHNSGFDFVSNFNGIGIGCVNGMA